MHDSFVLRKDVNSPNEPPKGHLLRSRLESRYMRRVLELNITVSHHPSVTLRVIF